MTGELQIWAFAHLIFKLEWVCVHSLLYKGEHIWREHTWKLFRGYRLQYISCMTSILSLICSPCCAASPRWVACSGRVECCQIWILCCNILNIFMRNIPRPVGHYPYIQISYSKDKNMNAKMFSLSMYSMHHEVWCYSSLWAISTFVGTTLKWLSLFHHVITFAYNGLRYSKSINLYCAWLHQHSWPAGITS